MNRREFIGLGGAAATIATLVGIPRLSAMAQSEPPILFTRRGIAARFEAIAEMHAAGAEYITAPVANVLLPDQPDAEFRHMRDAILAAPIPVLGCNLFLMDPRLHCTGPGANHGMVLDFAGIVFQRLREIGGRYVGFGSSGSRKLPDGWPKERADEQFMDLLRKMGPLAAKYDIKVTVEQLRRQECNYLNHVGEVLDIVEKVNHPNIRFLADLYHIAVMEDTPEDLKRAGPWLEQVEIAEKESRSVPGVMGDNFRPYFEALSAMGYSGPITIEGNGTLEEVTRAFTVIAAQARDGVVRQPHPDA